MIVDGQGHFDFDVVHLYDALSDSVDAEIRTHALELMTQPVDLSIGPVLGSRALSFSTECHALIIAIDHSVCDGTSIKIIFKEVWTCYDQAMNGRPFILPSVATSYLDYLDWKHRFDRGLRDEFLAYWQASLSNLPALRLPLDMPESIALGAQGEVLTYSFGTALTLDLRQVAKRTRMSFPMMFFAMYAAALMRSTGQKEAWIPFLSNGRYHPAFRSTIGCLILGLPLRLKLDAGDSFRTFLARLNTDFRSAIAHYPLPLPEVFSQHPSNFDFNWIRTWGWEQQHTADNSAINWQLQFDELEIHHWAQAIPHYYSAIFLERRSEVLIRIYHIPEHVPRHIVGRQLKNLALFAEQLSHCPDTPVREYE
jgi:hypothetical protein